MRKLKRSSCVVFPLVLKRKWYDMIESGEKKIEYRRAEYWLNRVYNWFKRCYESNGKLAPVVEFRHGYARDARRMAFVCGWVWNSDNKRYVYCTPPYVWIGNDQSPQHPEIGETQIDRVAIILGDRVELV